MTLAAMIACARREVAMRRSVYPKWVASGRMKQADADREIAAMEAIVQTLEGLEGQEERDLFSHSEASVMPDLIEVLTSWEPGSDMPFTAALSAAAVPLAGSGHAVFAAQLTAKAKEIDTVLKKARGEA